MTRPGNAPSYEEDFIAWLEDQARRAPRGEAGELDLIISPRNSKAWPAATGGKFATAWSCC